MGPRNEHATRTATAAAFIAAEKGAIGAGDARKMDLPVCSVCGTRGHTANACWHNPEATDERVIASAPRNSPLARCVASERPSTKTFVNSTGHRNRLPPRSTQTPSSAPAPWAGSPEGADAGSHTPLALSPTTQPRTACAILCSLREHSCAATGRPHRQHRHRLVGNMAPSRAMRVHNRPSRLQRHDRGDRRGRATMPWGGHAQHHHQESPRPNSPTVNPRRSAGSQRKPLPAVRFSANGRLVSSRTPSPSPPRHAVRRYLAAPCRS